jgi:hypothetical protein
VDEAAAPEQDPLDRPERLLPPRIPAWLAVGCEWMLLEVSEEAISMPRVTSIR